MVSSLRGGNYEKVLVWSNGRLTGPVYPLHVDGSVCWLQRRPGWFCKTRLGLLDWMGTRSGRFHLRRCQLPVFQGKEKSDGTMDVTLKVDVIVKAEAVTEFLG